MADDNNILMIGDRVYLTPECRNRLKVRFMYPPPKIVDVNHAYMKPYCIGIPMQTSMWLCWIGRDDVLFKSISPEQTNDKPAVPSLDKRKILQELGSEPQS